MRNALLVFTIAISSMLYTNAQSTGLGKLIVSPRIYVNYHLLGSDLLHKTRYINNNKFFKFYRPTIGVLIRKPEKNWAIEAEFTAWTWRQTQRVGYLNFPTPSIQAERYMKEQFLGIRIEYGAFGNFSILKKRMHYRMNISIQGFKSYDRYIPSYTGPPFHDRSRRIDKAGFILSLIPHLEIPLGQRLLININLPLSHLGIFKWKSYYIDRGWITNTGEYIIRLGAGVKL